MKLLDLKKQLISVSVLFTVGLSGCSSSKVNSETSSASGSVSQTTESEVSIASKPAEGNLSSVSLLTYFDFDSAKLRAETTVALDSAVDKFVINPSALVVISGHADEREERENITWRLDI